VIIKKTPAEIDAMAAAGEILVKCMNLLAGKVRPGVTTADLDAAAEKFIRSQGATPAFKGYRGFPGSICASPNDMVVHGIPGRFKLRRGDILSVDIGVVKDGWVADAARTFAVGEVSPVAAKLMEVTEGALFAAVEQCRPGNRLGDVSHAVQEHVEAHGFSIVRSLVGHGVGRDMHEEPQVPNYGKPGKGPLLEEGMVLAIEPMTTAGRPAVRVGGDGWAIFSQDGSPAAHFEFTVAITGDGPRVLTPWHLGSRGAEPVADAAEQLADGVPQGLAAAG
jgi:methionyl aminopeptidase